MSTLSIVFYTRGFLTQAAQSIPLKVDRYSWNMIGGPEKAYLSCPEFADMWSLFNLLRCPVEIYGGDGRLNWWGFVNKVTLPFGAQRVGKGLDGMVNYVKFQYSAGTTAAASDAISIAEYGQKEILLTDTNATSGQATQARDVYLAGNSLASQEAEFAGGGGNVQIECYGWYQTLDWKYYTDATSGNVEDTTQIVQIVTASGQFLVGTIVENTSGVSSDEKRDGTRTALQEINSLLGAGSSNSRPMLAWVDSKRYLHVYEQPAEPPAGTAGYILQRDGNLNTVTDDIVLPEWVTVGKWVQVRDAPISSKSTLALHAFFIERAEYKADTNQTTYSMAGSFEQQRLATFVRTHSHQGSGGVGTAIIPGIGGTTSTTGTSGYGWGKYLGTTFTHYESAAGLAISVDTAGADLTQFVFTAPADGWYLFGATGWPASSSSPTKVSVSIYGNSSTYSDMNTAAKDTTTTVGTAIEQCSVTNFIHLAETETANMSASINPGMSVNVVLLAWVVQVA